MLYNNDYKVIVIGLLSLKRKAEICYIFSFFSLLKKVPTKLWEITIYHCHAWVVNAILAPNLKVTKDILSITLPSSLFQPPQSGKNQIWKRHWYTSNNIKNWMHPFLSQNIKKLTDGKLFCSLISCNLQIPLSWGSLTEFHGIC